MLHSSISVCDNRLAVRWVGLYKDRTCEDGVGAHECYEGSDSVTTIGLSYAGTVSFSYPKDYSSAGHYNLRYFAGDASGVVCKVCNCACNSRHIYFECELACSRSYIFCTCRFLQTYKIGHHMMRVVRWSQLLCITMTGHG